MFWEGKQVVITGIAGLIGAPLAKMLLEAGAEVTGYDKDPIGILPAYGIEHDIKIIQGDILDVARVKSALSGAGVVFHLAANSGVIESAQAGMQTFEINTRGTWIVLEASHAAEVEAVVVASTNHAYGDHEGQPTDEHAQLRRLDTYTVSKIAADYIARSYAYNYGLKVGVVRNTNCFGPNDPHDSHIIPATILSLLRGSAPIIKGDGKTKKSYLHVDDVARAYMLVAGEVAEHDASPDMVFNVSDEVVSVNQLVRWIMGLMKYDSLQPVVEGEERNEAQENLDSQKIRDLGWKPLYGLAEALEDTIEAFRVRLAGGRNPKGKKYQAEV